MRERLRALALAVLRIPAAPHPPAGDPAQTRVFRAAPGYFRYRLLVWALRQAAVLAGLVVSVVALSYVLPAMELPFVAGLIRAAEVFAWAGYVVQLPVSYALLLFDYEMRWYIVSDRSLRIREGILAVREQTITFANVQHVGIRQGPLQRLLGIADVHVRTAGGGGGTLDKHEHGGGRSMHEGFFRGVDRAAEIREAIRARVRLHRDAGLGDPDDPEHGGGEPAPALDAARELLSEVRALRGALGARPAAGDAPAGEGARGLP